MTKIAKGVLKNTASFPWYEWTEEFEWDDDEIQGSSISGVYNDGQLDTLFDTFASKYDRLKTQDDK